MNVLTMLDPVIRDPHSGEPVGRDEDMAKAQAAIAELFTACDALLGCLPLTGGNHATERDRLRAALAACR